MFEFVKNRQAVTLSLSRYFKRSKGLIGAITAVKVFMLLTELAGPMLFALLVGNVMANKNLDLLLPVCAGYLLLFIAVSAAKAVELRTTNKIQNKLMFGLRLDLWDRFTRMPYDQYKKLNTSDLKIRMNDDVSQMGSFIKEQIIEYYYYILLSVAYLIAIFVINPLFALISIVFIPVMFYLSMHVSKKRGAALAERTIAYKNSMAFEYDTFQKWKEIKANNLERRQIRHYYGYANQYAKTGFLWLYYLGLGTIVYIIRDEFISKIMLYLIAALFVYHDQLTIAAVILFMQYYQKLSVYIRYISNSETNLIGNKVSYDRVRSMLESDPGKSVYEGEKAELTGKIELRNVSFSYGDTGEEALNKINLSIKSGEYIAIMGKSGSGKSTLVKLLLGLYKPQQGQIVYDGLPMEEISGKVFFNHVGVVMQDNLLFDMSIRDNLLFAKRNATQTDIEEACEKAGIMDFIAALPEGFNTIIGERGLKLSGGQKQRLTIAQVILRKPRVFIFDEATSALDHNSEARIRQSIRELSANNTVIVIAHRRASVADADRIVVMRDGEIVDTGTHEQLSARSEYYFTEVNNYSSEGKP